MMGRQMGQMEQYRDMWVMENMMGTEDWNALRRQAGMVQCKVLRVEQNKTAVVMLDDIVVLVVDYFQLVVWLV